MMSCRPPLAIVVTLFALLSTLTTARNLRGTGSAATGRLVELYPFYHDSAQLRSELERLSTKCSGQMTIENRTDDGVNIDLIRVKADAATPNNKMFIVSGEHARELIGPESVLHLLKALCGEVDLGADRTAKQVLANTEFAVVLNANPVSRKQVEGGEFCQRMNPNGVDLNRNWDEHWESSAQERESDPGTEPFSEAETRIVRDMMSDFKPTSYISVHSGTYGMYMPWAYSTTADLPSRNQKQMLSVLKNVDEKHCQCPFGAAGKEVGYSCPGTSVDWVYEQLQASYSFAVEIYVDEPKEDFRKRWNDILQSPALEGVSFLQQANSTGKYINLKDDRVSNFFREHPSDFVGLQLQKEDAGAKPLSLLEARDDGVGSPTWCFSHYNPSTQADYDENVKTWASAFLDMSLQVSLNMAA